LDELKMLIDTALLSLNALDATTGTLIPLPKEY
jgi:hypothetical protein